MRAIVLPGLDGCADLRKEFVEALTPEIGASVVAFPGNVPLGYDGLAEFARVQLPRDQPFVPIGESFSGPLAIRLAAERPEGLTGLVLCATFARTPMPLLALVRWLVSRLPLLSLPMAIVMPVMMGRWSTPEWKWRLRRALQEQDSDVLRRRVAEVMNVDAREELAQLSCPLIGITAASDRLLRFDNWRTISEAQPGATRVAVDGPHMLLQASPQECLKLSKDGCPPSGSPRAKRSAREALIYSALLPAMDGGLAHHARKCLMQRERVRTCAGLATADQFPDGIDQPFPRPKNARHRS